MADWCFCLCARTQEQARGISFLLIDMKTPHRGASDPADQRNSPFCETFFTDVKVPKENLVGQLNHGWTIAKRLLNFERQSLSGGGGGGGLFGPSSAIWPRNMSEPTRRRIDDPDLRSRVIQHQMEARASC